MSLAVFENFLRFAEGAVAAKAALPSQIDAAEFESALVSYGVVVLYAQVEQCVRSAFDLKCGKCADVEVRTFALSVKNEKTGKLRIEHLKGTLGRFGDSCKQRFRDRFIVRGTDTVSKHETSWESVMNQRHIVAHEGNPARCSLDDLRLFYGDVRMVLGFLCDALGLDAAEIAGISKLIIIPLRSVA